MLRYERLQAITQRSLGVVALRLEQREALHARHADDAPVGERHRTCIGDGNGARLRRLAEAGRRGERPASGLAIAPSVSSAAEACLQSW